MRLLFASALLLALASALPTPPPAAEAEKPSAAKPVYHGPAKRAGLLESAKRFFASFHKSKTAHETAGVNHASLRAFSAEYKKMTTWYCSQSGHDDERMCMIQAGKAVTTENAKPTSITEVKKRFCALEANKEAKICNMLMGGPGGLRAINGKNRPSVAA